MQETGAAGTGVANVKQRCRMRIMRNCCTCGIEIYLCSCFHVWDRGAVFASFPYVGQSFIGAYVSCVGKRCSICISCMCGTEFYWCICFMCGTEVQYLHVGDRVLLVHMFHLWDSVAVYSAIVCVGVGQIFSVFNCHRLCGKELQYVKPSHVWDRVAVC